MIRSLFERIPTKVPVRYIIHWDNSNTCWNVFKKYGIREDYVCQFAHLPEAQQYCNDKNDIGGK